MTPLRLATCFCLYFLSTFVFAYDYRPFSRTTDISGVIEGLKPRSIASRAADDSYLTLPSTVSHRDVNIGGIAVTVYGEKELRTHDKNIAVVWLHHGRGQKREDMAPFAHAVIDYWRGRHHSGTASGKTSSGLGVIAVSLDQRNHGPRETDPLRSQAWTQGNPTHATDMYAIFGEPRPHLPGHFANDMNSSDPRGYCP